MIEHKKCGGIIESSGKGDWGICNKCNKRVDIMMIGRHGKPTFNKDVKISTNRRKGMKCYNIWLTEGETESMKESLKAPEILGGNIVEIIEEATNRGDFNLK